LLKTELRYLWNLEGQFLTGTAGVSPAFVECHFLGIVSFDLSGSSVFGVNPLLEAGETPAVPVLGVRVLACPPFWVNESSSLLRGLVAMVISLTPGSDRNQSHTS
jgi:hypothetical protein